IAAGRFCTAALVLPIVPTIAAQPASQTVSAWQSPSFTVVATGLPLYYQWRKDGGGLAGATSPSYSLPLAHTNQSGSRYTVVVSNPAGSVTSAPPAILSVNTTAVSGDVVAWGDNASGKTTLPAAAQSGVTAIAAGGEVEEGGFYGHTVTLKSDGLVLAW